MRKGLDEKYLVNEVLSGNKNAFMQLIKQYEGLVLHVVTPLVGVNQDREDICQDVFLKVYEKLHTFQFKSKLATWIGNIAYNISINFLRKKRSVLLSGLVSADNEISFVESLQFETNNPEQIIIKNEDIDKLNASIDRLPEIQRTVLLLFYQDELSLNEVGKILEIPINTVKSHLFRARNLLKQFLNEDKIRRTI